MYMRGEKLECVDGFSYFGSSINEVSDSSREIYSIGAWKFHDLFGIKEESAFVLRCNSMNIQSCMWFCMDLSIGFVRAKSTQSSIPSIIRTCDR